ncbi:M23 family metallopeptidase [Paenibacillus albidus]|uniref:M23 family metallopeptidase n=1 Tax=Paenibacillus albidus TaxID=2041023 RepID=UPI001BE75F4B|nr:M23 family metallopeptidase [Paenibacillus albidus]MBT2290497.1 M23 family metallopeptidase [Paenibacillus albidus]
MERKSDIRGRRKERIRSLLLQEVVDNSEVSPLPATPGTEKPEAFIEWGTGHRQGQPSSPEPDPEVMWKKQRGGWEEYGGGNRPSLLAGFIQRTVASILVFAAVWGVFAIQQPWSLKVQAFVREALNKDMDFEAARVWYEEHFNGAPAFIPIFGDKEEPAEKVAAPHELGAPVAGSIVQSFAATLKGVEIMPVTDSSGSVTVKSVDVGRVLSVSRELQGGIRITVRHTGSMTAEYGHLSGTKLKADDWVQSGEAVGWMLAEEDSPLPTLFFAVMHDKAYIDPADVISFD